MNPGVRAEERNGGPNTSERCEACVFAACAHQLLGEENLAQEHALIHYGGAPTLITPAVRVSARVNGSREEFGGEIK